ncbi:hypothetical protein HPB51_013222 [Rhipicephalus microplus]|uniref:Ribosomal protein eL8/eL30/eS12/Gadd45 domain-containing protein n=1 Tax=Rhipicephalus microplus TaxID=6941 RepID=A0A9J6DN97_RHIMP|nr:hypothetical protein HPB51_013222 [Rhipicephalus microplus]
MLRHNLADLARRLAEIPEPGNLNSGEYDVSVNFLGISCTVFLQRKERKLAPSPRGADASVQCCGSRGLSRSTSLSREDEAKQRLPWLSIPLNPSYYLNTSVEIIIKEREDRRQRREKLRLLTAARQGCLANSASEVVVELDPATESNEEIGLQETPLSRIEPNSEAQPEVKQLHSTRFRDYCDHVQSPEINKTTKALLADLVFYQDRLYQKDPIKARSKRRLVYGLKEVRKYLLLNKLKCIVFAPDIEEVKGAGGLDHSLRDMIDYARAHFVPIVFALRRRHLGTLAKKNVPAQFKELLELVSAARETYAKLKQELTQDDSISCAGRVVDKEPESTGRVRCEDDSASVGVVLDDDWVTANEESDAEDFENSLTTVAASKNLDSLAQLLALTLRSAGRES